jgi:hypothetical protein
VAVAAAAPPVRAAPSSTTAVQSISRGRFWRPALAAIAAEGSPTTAMTLAIQMTSQNSASNIDLRAALADNGGPTETLALTSANSAAVDKIPAAMCPATDQRGVARPDNMEAFCDIGAYEFQDPPPSPFAGTPGAANCNGQTVSTLSNEFGTLDTAASALSYPSVKALQAAIKAFCAGCRSAPRGDFREQPNRSVLEVAALEGVAVAQAARPDLDGFHVLFIVAVVGDEPRAAVCAIHFQRSLRFGRRLFVAAKAEIKLLATGLF